LDRNHEEVTRNYCVDSQDPNVGRTIEQYDIILASWTFESFSQDEFAAPDGGEFDFCSCKVKVARNDGKIFDFGVQGDALNLS
jgi:hypothetical protein